MKKTFLLSLVFFLFLIFTTTTIYALEDDRLQEGCKVFDNYVLCPGEINQGKNFYAKITFTNVPKIEDPYRVCLNSNLKDCREKANLISLSEKAQQNPFSGFKSSPKIEDNPDGTQNIIFTLCAMGEGALEQNEKCEDKEYSKKHWFHPGKTYRVSLYEPEKNSEENNPEIIRSAVFYAQHFYPEVISPKETDNAANLNLKTHEQSKKLIIPVELGGRNKADNNDDKLNDYWIQVEGYENDYQTQGQCLFVPMSTNASEEKGKIELSLPFYTTSADGSEVSTLTEGDYVIKIKDGKNGNFAKNPITRAFIPGTEICSENDFTYYYIPFRITEDGDGIIGKAIKDPLNKELGQNDRKEIPTPIPICARKDPKTGYCTVINTALGQIHTKPEVFVQNIFSIVLSIAGVVAIAFFIRAGYTIMTSAGNKEKVGQAREQITAAITGLIFIILSIAMLEFIGVNILRIPGFQ